VWGKSILRDQPERLPVQQLTVIFTDGRRHVVQNKMIQLQIPGCVEINRSSKDITATFV